MTPLIARIANLIHEQNYYVCNGKKRGRDCDSCIRVATEIADMCAVEFKKGTVYDDAIGRHAN